MSIPLRRVAILLLAGLAVTAVIAEGQGGANRLTATDSHQAAKVLEVLAWFDQHRQRK